MHTSKSGHPGSLTERLRASLLDGQLVPGQKLHLETLRHRYGVSLSPLREALTRLSATGLVVTGTQQGYRAAPMTPDNLREVLALKVELECLALRASMRHGDDAWEAQLVAADYRLRRIEAAGPLEPPRLADWERAHAALHQQLLAACGMPLLLQLCAQLHDLNDRYRRVLLAHQPVSPASPQEHSDIVRAALERRVEPACELLRAHIERIGLVVLQALERHQARRDG